MGMYFDDLKDEKHKEFVELLGSGHADTPEAAYRQVYKTKNPTQIVERSTALLLKEPIRMALEEIQIERKVKYGHTADRLLAKLMDGAFRDMEGLLDENGEVKSLKDLPKQLLNIVKSVEEVTRWAGRGEDKTPVRTYKLKFISQEKCLELLGKNLSVFVEQVRLSGDQENPVQVMQRFFTEVAAQKKKGIPTPVK